MLSQAEVGKRMQELRQRLGFDSQESFAKHVGVGQPIISRCEAGHGYPSFTTLFKMVQKGVDVSELLKGDRPTKSKEVP